MYRSMSALSRWLFHSASALSSWFLPCSLARQLLPAAQAVVEPLRGFAYDAALPPGAG